MKVKAKGNRLEREWASLLRESGLDKTARRMPLKKNSNAYKHGMRSSRQYRTWSHMKGRCQDKNDKQYKNYGGRGITICDKWQSFEGFWEEMGSSYEDHLTLERINVNGNYCKENCKWATWAEQRKNKQNTRKISFMGKILTLGDWSKETGIKRTTLRMRLDKYGYSVEKTLTEKVTYNHG